MDIPLAERLRPKHLRDYISQPHLVGASGILTKFIETGVVPSLLFWGPPGSGKTTLAQLLAAETTRPFYSLSAVNAGVKDVREVIDRAKRGGGIFDPQKPLLFIDEIHRFSKSQQDSLLEAVEKGWLTLIGATTENPSFEVIPALLSRCQLYVLESFGVPEMETLIRRALAEDVLLKTRQVKIEETTALMRYSGGDARKLLNLLELVVLSQTSEPAIINDAQVLAVAQQQMSRYDKSGEMHYDVVSAFIKSIRGSDPNAAIYWLGRMLSGGEDVKFIARRLVILASEDIGNANPTALVLANSTFQAVSAIGNPESRIILAQCAVYLASSPKSNSTYVAINEALALIEKLPPYAVPLHLRNAPTKLMKELGYGEEYQYAHSFEGNFAFQEYLPEELSGTKFYEPGTNSRETTDRAFLKKRWGDKYGY
ncbi:replication-associated recombination protein A [Flavobacterium aurantiibacter]|uniref:Replication-associated recombination protein A n=1 Tax=Flavobacterium aurantiibacter TaxID=2023067 RepID=A0A255ZP47_9FLAO|nr:replication-associated recombination protein A [Flavobacterium aurantiibacter]OYQ43191.1 AAA family ATPase [Flavobacterium aurantiibacter]